MYAYQTTEVADYASARLARGSLGQDRALADVHEATPRIFHFPTRPARPTDRLLPSDLPAIDGEDAELTPATTRDAARLEIVGSADGRWFEAATAAETPSAPADVPDDAKAPFALAFGRLVCVLTALGSLGAMILIVT